MDGLLEDVMHRARPTEQATRAEEVSVEDRLRRQYATLRVRYPHLREMASIKELEAFVTASELDRYSTET
jgi:hypothetical protein